MIIQPQGGCVISSSSQKERNRVAVGLQNHSRPRVVEAVTLRWKTLTALRFALSSSRLDVSSQIGNNN